MNIVVLGASGGCGQFLVSQARARDHDVTAVVRGAGYVPPAGVTVLRGDLTDVTFLREAVRGKDAVMSALGLRLTGIAPWDGPVEPDFLVKSTRAIVAAMKAEGARRILAISAGGVGDSRGKVPAFFRAFIATTSLRRVYPELERMEQLLFDAPLRHTLIERDGRASDDIEGGRGGVDAGRAREAGVLGRGADDHGDGRALIRTPSAGGW